MTEPSGFSDFVERHSRALLRAAWLMTGDWPTAEDLVQTAFVAAWRHWAKIAHQDAAGAYTHKVLVRTYLRSRRRRWTAEIPTMELPERSARDETAHVDLATTLASALTQLPTKQRSVIALRYLMDLSEGDTATALGCSVGTVKAQSSRGLAKLRTIPQLTQILDGGPE